MVWVCYETWYHVGARPIRRTHYKVCSRQKMIATHYRNMIPSATLGPSLGYFLRVLSERSECSRADMDVLASSMLGELQRVDIQFTAINDQLRDMTFGDRCYSSAR
jgi:hypothetical protein